MPIADGGLRREVQKWLGKPEWAWTPVETGATQQGVPDSFFAHPSMVSGWVEHKKTDGWAVTMRPHQIGWIERHVERGVHVRILVRARGVGSSAGTGDSLWAVRGSYVRALSELGLDGVPPQALLGTWSGSPRSWDWRAVAAALLHRDA